jgi:CTP synthase
MLLFQSVFDRQNIQKPDTRLFNVQTKFIFVTGGVMSGLGKGVTTYQNRSIS